MTTKKENAYIMTFHFATNYGAILQCIAMSNILKEYYNKVEIINYVQSNMNKEENVIQTKNIKSFIDSVYSSITQIKRKKSFLKTKNKYIEETTQFNLNEEVKNLKDGNLYLGSDQIWNPEITKYDKSYFGNFKNQKFSNTFSYAASIGIAELDKKKEQFIKENIINIDMVSVREETAQKLISNITDKKIDVVLDPTLILSKEEWINIFNLKKKENKYIFLYTLTANEETMKAAEKISKRMNLPIIEIAGKRKTLKRMPKHKIYYDKSPVEFVELLMNSTFVITDSFHATAFSIIFEKNFMTTQNKKRGSRIQNLLNYLQIEKRYTNDYETIENDKIDYKDVKTKLKAKQKSSIEFIEKTTKFNK